MRNLCQRIVSAEQWKRSAKGEWAWKATEEYERACGELPSGSGIDNGCHVMVATEDRLVIEVPFHHMNEHGMYDGWWTFTVTVKPSLLHPTVKVTAGRGAPSWARDQYTKDYIGELLDHALFGGE